jgi:hypothetical protein
MPELTIYEIQGCNTVAKNAYKEHNSLTDWFQTISLNSAPLLADLFLLTCNYDYLA